MSGVRRCRDQLVVLRVVTAGGDLFREKLHETRIKFPQDAGAFSRRVRFLVVCAERLERESAFFEDFARSRDIAVVVLEEVAFKVVDSGCFFLPVS